MASCSSSCSSSGSCPSSGGRTAPGGALEDRLQARQELMQRMSPIRHKIIVMSGKGGVGKSTVAVNLAAGLAAAGHSVGLLDVDIHGPSVPKLLGIEDRGAGLAAGAITPVLAENGLKVMSIGFLLRNPDDAVIWRGPMKMGAIQQFLKDVEWGACDWLVIDAPPGTGDEPLSICQLLPDLTGAVVVTTPQEVALADVRKSINFCRKLGISVLGVIENMSGFVCPHCGEVTDILGRNGGEKMAEKMGVPFLGRLPLDPEVARGGDAGKPFVGADSATSRAFQAVLDQFLRRVEAK